MKNFEVFGDMVDNPNYDDKMKTIDLAQGSDWKNIRKVLSPTFTSGKLKGMLEPMTDVAEKAMNHLDKLVEKNEPIAMKNFFQVLHDIHDGYLSGIRSSDSSINSFYIITLERKIILYCTYLPK